MRNIPTRLAIGILLAVCVCLALTGPVQAQSNSPVNRELNSSTITLTYGRMQELTELSKMICYRVALENAEKTKARINYETRFMTRHETVFVSMLCILYLEGLSDMNTAAEAAGASAPTNRT